MLGGLACALVVAAARAGPGEGVVPSDSFLRLYAETRRFAAGRPVSAKLTPDGRAALFLRSPPRSPVQSLYETDLATGETRERLAPQALLGEGAGSPTADELTRLERQRIAARGFTHFELSADGARVVAGLGGRLFALQRASGRVTPLGAGADALDPHLSPDGRSVAYVRGGELQILDLSANRERQLTHGASEWRTHGLAEFVAQEEMERSRGFWWSPDSRLLAYEEADSSDVEKLSVGDPMRPEQAPRRFAYPRAGRENARVRLGLVPAAGGANTWVDWDAARYPYLATVVWEEGGPLSILVQNRAQTEEALLAVDPATGRTRRLLVERDPAWLNLHQDFPRWLEDGSGFLWLTEREGGPELELRARDGALRRVLVAPRAGFVALAGVDAARRRVYFTACGDDPSSERLFAVDLAGAAAEEVAVGEGPAHVEAGLSKDGSALLVTTSAVSHLRRSFALRPDGARLAELPSVAVEPPFTSTAEVRRVGPGSGLYATVLRPRDFHPGRKLPVVVSVYGGPLPLEWTPFGANRTMRLIDQWLADQGFIVVTADGRGTPRRGREFERAIKGDLAGASLDDQVAALRALAAEIPEMDLGRVGIQGWSFGGYLSAMAVMKRPEVFRAAVAGAPVADYLTYDTHYSERYLGLPQEEPEAYRRSSLLTHAPRLRRPLLVIHGTADDNVYFAHSLMLSDALFRAGREHEFLPLSGLTHMVPEPLVVERLQQKIAGFFARTLGRAQPEDP